MASAGHFPHIFWHSWRPALSKRIQPLWDGLAASEEQGMTAVRLALVDTTDRVAARLQP